VTPFDCIDAIPEENEIARSCKTMCLGGNVRAVLPKLEESKRTILDSYTY
jgi:hypothetical protein